MEVTGTVTYRGELLKKGQIRFFPLQETKGPASGAAIEQGSYRVTNRGGLPAGKYRVEIRAYHGDESLDLPLDGGPPHREQFIPSRYNDQSEVTTTVPTEVRKYELNFELIE